MQTSAAESPPTNAQGRALTCPSPASPSMHPAMMYTRLQASCSRSLGGTAQSFYLCDSPNLVALISQIACSNKLEVSRWDAADLSNLQSHMSYCENSLYLAL